MYNLKQTSYFSWIYSKLFMSKQIVLIEKLCYKATLIKRGALSWPGTIVHSCQTNISPKTPAHYNLGKIKCLEKTRVSVGNCETSSLLIATNKSFTFPDKIDDLSLNQDVRFI